MEQSTILGSVTNHRHVAVYVIVEINGNLIGRGITDYQRDVKVISAFTDKNDAVRYISNIGKSNNRYMIHESILNPIIPFGKELWCVKPQEAFPN